MHKKFKEENLPKVRQNVSNTAKAPPPDNELQAAAEEAMRDHRMNRVGPQGDSIAHMAELNEIENFEEDSVSNSSS